MLRKAVIHLDDSWHWQLAQGEDAGPVKAAIYIQVDPAGIEPPSLDIYTDDGRGNGNLIGKVTLY